MSNVMTGKRMLETLQRIFLEMDEMGRPMATVVSCPHGDKPRGKSGLCYMGRDLDFCVYCHDLVVAEFDSLNGGLAKSRSEYLAMARSTMAGGDSPLNIPNGYRWPLPEELRKRYGIGNLMDCVSGPVGDQWPRLDPDLCPDLELLKVDRSIRK